eukprot:CAMPEP_0115521264 /NCGR_PEP_ID=MMETSP0271-20121206/79447_1 /TAXON_ID=71861 /ORGANISM="Scrippsiella trochoidea, Strain CCMP3099" /LENGTH=96 /DNA_ID=CAMNT_0002952471 /DNA_START=96 /DNA_END=386 /DNA_ORIENTATION=+
MSEWASLHPSHHEKATKLSRKVPILPAAPAMLKMRMTCIASAQAACSLAAAALPKPGKAFRSHKASVHQTKAATTNTIKPAAMDLKKKDIVLLCGD